MTPKSDRNFFFRTVQETNDPLFHFLYLADLQTYFSPFIKETYSWSLVVNWLLFCLGNYCRIIGFLNFYFIYSFFFSISFFFINTIIKRKNCKWKFLSHIYELLEKYRTHRYEKKLFDMWRHNLMYFSIISIRFYLIL